MTRRRHRALDDWGSDRHYEPPARPETVAYWLAVIRHTLTQAAERARTAPADR